MEPNSSNSSTEQTQLLTQLKKSNHLINKDGFLSMIKWDETWNETTGKNCTGTLVFNTLDIDELVIPETLFYDRFMEYVNLFRKETEIIRISLKLDVNVYIKCKDLKFLFGGIQYDKLKKFEIEYYEVSDDGAKKVLKDTINIIPVFHKDFINEYNRIHKTTSSLYRALRKGIYKGKPYQLTDLVSASHIEIRVKFTSEAKSYQNGKPVVHPELFADLYARPPKNWTDPDEIKDLTEQLQNKFKEWKINFYLLNA